MLQIKTTLHTLFHDFSYLIYPRLCICCNKYLIKQEEHICFECLIDIPRTNFHKEENNAIEQIFWGRTQIKKATSFFYFNKGSRYQHILHLLKYHHMPEVGEIMGRHFGAELFHNSYFHDIDLIIPVPLHPKKQKKRGYNQSYAIAKGLAYVLKKKINSTCLIRATYTQTQTNKSRFGRWENVDGIFALLHPEVIQNKNILIVDDVITTGATIEACAQELQKGAPKSLSLATLACSLI